MQSSPHCAGWKMMKRCWCSQASQWRCFKSHPDAPRVLIANSNLVPHWATQEHFDRLAAQGLTMYGQMTAGSWIYIGTQGILQGTYETLAALARQKGWPSLRGRFILTAGLGGMGGAQPLAITMNGGVGLVVEVDPERACQRRLETGYIDQVVDSLEEAMTLVDESVRQQEPRSIGLIGNAAEIYPELARLGVVPDVVTDQTPAHDVLMYIPIGLSVDEAGALRQTDPAGYYNRSMDAMARHVRAMLEFKQHGAEVFDYGNNLRQRAYDGGVTDAFEFPGFVPAYIRPLFCEGKGPFRWVALSGDPEDIYRTDEAVMRLFPDDEHLQRWLIMARQKVHFQGCRHASAGWATASVPAPGWNSTAWWRKASSGLPLLSGATTSTPARWLHPTAKPKGCAMAAMPSVIGRFSMPSLTRLTAPRGCPSITAGVWGSGTASMPGR